MDGLFRHVLRGDRLLKEAGWTPPPPSSRTDTSREADHPRSRIEVGFGTNTIMKDLDFSTCFRGEILGFVGGSWAGKIGFLTRAISGI